MNRLTLSLCTLAIAALPAMAGAQTANGTITFNGDINGANGSIGGAAVGPYKADLNGFSPLLANTSNAAIWCVDFNHLAPTVANDTYVATLLTGGVTFTQTRAGAATNYLKAAYLIEHSAYFGGSFSDQDVQGTIWKMMSGTPVTGFTDLLGSVPVSFTLSRDWFVLSDLEADNSCTRFSSSTCTSNQEFLTTSNVLRFTATPEPSSYALMAAGLAGLGLAARRRRRTVA